MATSYKLLIVQTQDGVIGVEEFRMEDDLDTICASVEQLYPSDLIENWVIGVVCHVVGYNRGQRVSLESEDATFE